MICNLGFSQTLGFFQSIARSPIDSLQDTLRLIMLWFRYQVHEEVNDAIRDGILNVNVNTWLQVIPQLIARIHVSNIHVRQLLHDLLTSIGKAHPQGIIYSLMVASRSNNIERKSATSKILDHMRQHSPLLVDQAILLSEELIRIAVLWHEMWHEGLEEASRLYFGDQNPQAMFTVIDGLYNYLEKVTLLSP